MADHANEAAETHRSRLPWVIAGAAVVVAIFAAGIALGVVLTRPDDRGHEDTAASATTGPTSTTSTSSTTTTVATTSTTIASTTTPRVPRGQVIFNTAPRDGFGQTFGSGNCSVWLANLSNQSDTAAYGFVVESPGGHWTNGRAVDDGYREWSAAPNPGEIDIYLAAGDSSDVRFSICTSVPPPEGATEYVTLAGLTLRHRWDL